MKKLNDLLAKRATLIAQMEEINKNETLTDEQTRSWEELDAQVENLNKEIERAKKQDELNKILGSTKEPEVIEERKAQPLEINFRDWLHDAVKGKADPTFTVERDQAFYTTTDSAIIEKTVNGTVDILTSPAEAFLRTLGVTFYPGLTGNFIVPSMAEDLATFLAEGAVDVSAGMGTSSLTLAPRRVGHQQAISKETLAQTNPGIYASILQNLVNGVWNAITNDVFDTLETDGATQVSSFKLSTTTNVSNAMLVQMEASLGTYIGGGLNTVSFVTHPTVKAYLKNTIALGTTSGPAIWRDDNTVNGYPAYGVPAANTLSAYLGDFSRQVVGQWGGFEITVDPYTMAKNGIIVLTMNALVDTGCANKRAFVIMKDCSI